MALEQAGEDVGDHHDDLPVVAPAKIHLEENPVDSDLELTDDGTYPLVPQISRDEVESVVGVSIGRAQSHYKSSQTPAAEKLELLAHSTGLQEFEQADEGTTDAHDLVTESRERQQDGISKAKEHERLPSQPSVAPRRQQPRSTAARSILREATAPSRRRASSGPLAVADGFKKLLNDMPSLSLPRSPNMSSFPFSQRSTETQSKPRRANTILPRMNGQWLPTSLRDLSPGPPSEGRISTPRSSHGVGLGLPTLAEGSGSRLNKEGSSGVVVPKSRRSQDLRRVNSDESLYLQRSLSRASTLDETDKWEHVQEQVNSRLKAITDSLQDSKFRMPKMPSVDLSYLRPAFISRLDLGHSEDTSEPRKVTDDTKPDISTDPRRSTVSQQSPPAIAIGEESDKHPLLSSALTELTGDVVVLGGYRGSILRSAQPPHRQLWIPIKVGLNLRKVDLEVGLTREDEERMEETIIPSGVLSHIGPIDICRRLLRKLNKCSNSREGTLRVHDYGYDWRLSPDLLVDRLISFLERLDCNKVDTPNKTRGATVIAHSLGGLLVRSAINRRPDLFAGVIYAGVPQHCVNILGPLRNGDDVLFSSRVLTAQVNFTLRTSFALMPESGICFFNKETKERYDVDFFDAKTWDEYRLTPCLQPPLPPYQSQEQRKSFIHSVSGSIASIPKRTSNAVPRDASAQSPTATTVMEAAERQFDMMENSALEPSMRSLPTNDLHNSSTSVATRVTIPRQEAFEYLKRTLAAVKAFKQSCAFDPELQSSNQYPPAAVLYSKSTPTVYGARVACREAIKHSDAYDDLAFAAGDGVVLAKAAMLPAGYRVVKGGLVRSDRGHVGLLGDLEGVGECLLAVLEGRRKGIGVGTAASAVH